MRKYLIIVLLSVLATAWLVGCSDDTTYKPVITRIEANVDCGYPPIDIQFVAFVSGGDPSADPTGANSNLTLEWDFADGSTGTGSIITHRYLEPGVFEVFATVTDDDGDSDQASVVVSLLPDSLFVTASNDTTVTASKAYFETPTLGDDGENGASNGTGGNSIRPHLVINEILAFNESIIQNPVNAQYEPVLELYNPTDSNINMGGWSLSNDASNPGLWEFPPSINVPAGGYRLIWVDNRDLAGDNHTNFHMTNNWTDAPEDYDGKVYLYDPAGQEIDRAHLLNQRADVSFGHLPDACNDGLTPLNVMAELCGFDPIHGLYERFDFEWVMDDVLGSVYADRMPLHVFTTDDEGVREVVVTVFDTHTSVTRRDTVYVTVELPD